MSIESTIQNDPRRSEDEIDLIGLMDAVRQRWRLAITVFVLCFALAILFLQMASYKYTIELQVTPVQSATEGGLGGQLGGLRGLASVAGISLGGGKEMNDFQLYLESLKSRSVAEELAGNAQLMRQIFGNEWNAQTGKWQQPPTRLRGLKNLVKTILGIPSYPWRAPDGARLQEYLSAAIEIDQQPERAVVDLRVKHPNPQFAIELLTAAHQAADSFVRRKSQARSSEYIKYLSGKLETVSIAEHRMAIAQTLSEQEKTLMMSSATSAFAAEPFGAPAASARPTTPQPLLVLVAGIILGAMLSLLVVALSNMRRVR